MLDKLSRSDFSSSPDERERERERERETKARSAWRNDQKRAIEERETTALLSSSFPRIFLAQKKKRVLTLGLMRLLLLLFF